MFDGRGTKVSFGVRQRDSINKKVDLVSRAWKIFVCQVLCPFVGRILETFSQGQGGGEALGSV